DVEIDARRGAAVLFEKHVAYLAARARARAAVSGGAADDARIGRCVALDLRGAFEFRRDRTDLHAHRDLDLVCRGHRLNRCTGQAGGDFIEAAEEVPDFRARMVDAEGLVESGLRLCIDASRPGPLHGGLRGETSGRFGGRRDRRRDSRMRLAAACREYALDRAHDTDVARAAAEISGELLADARLVRIRKPRHDVAR